MFKWGFYILLGINVFLFAKQSTEQTKRYDQNSSLEPKQKKNMSRVARAQIIEKVVYKNATQFSTSEHEQDLEFKVKENLLELHINRSKNTYTYFYEFNELPVDKFREVEITLAEMNCLKYECLGDRSFDEVLLSKLNNTSLTLSEIDHAFKLIDQQWTCNQLENMGFNNSLVNGSYTSLVDEYHLYLSNLRVGLHELVIDPFESADPFEESDEAPIDGLEDIEDDFAVVGNDYDDSLDELEDDLEGGFGSIENQKTKLEIEAEIQEELIALKKLLTEKGVIVYESQLEIISSYKEINNSVRLSLLKNMLY